ncbi:hypothetical protein TREMEDRAFT_62870 [Tremella mesenterica DSM 1558]|uniref:uncharacterized protein n=1 Tax=Tremella mesenterica (strain ATCC 24925 / CBS 8224 / DSM 1558 / NBRC 9311 / NRRL Y-6157 / RJB 2259-6 / UBC 559-6) TaxID=578456 RepID=UPI0003F490AA|nr:uncharacterized protein TREMEDRAFT_62870 [Tremella mesenterica DSM 1558]EIW69141.1 hypothetical protein TREMEDRAFT_62870 [Tremella mesenterica DSM 1558]
MSIFHRLDDFLTKQLIHSLSLTILTSPPVILPSLLTTHLQTLSTPNQHFLQPLPGHSPAAGSKFSSFTSGYWLHKSHISMENTRDKAPPKKNPGNPGFKRDYYNSKRIEPDTFYPDSPYFLQEFFDKRTKNHNPRPLNNSQQTFDELLRKENIELPPATLISSSQFPFAIPCSLDDVGTPNGRPKFWLMAFNLNLPRDNHDIMNAWEMIEKTKERPFHPGVWFPSNCRKDHTRPFLSKDARSNETQQFMTTFDRIAGGGTLKNLRKFDPVTSKRMSHTYSIISVFGSGGWKSSAENRQGWLVLPQLNIEVEMPVDGDKRLVVTAFACSEMSKYYEGHKHEIVSKQVGN